MPNVINATSTGNGGLITQGDDSGILNIQTNETTAITVDASQIVSYTNNLGTVAGYPAYQCRAWVNFNGIGTVSIRGSGNVSSITDNATGRYTINFTTAMPDANYSVSGITQNVDEMGIMIDGVYDTTPAVMTASALKIDTARSSTTYDCTTVCVQIFR